MSSAEEELELILSVVPPEEATLMLLKVMFKQLAETAATVDLIIPVLGAIAGRLGLTQADLKRLAEMSTP